MYQIKTLNAISPIIHTHLPKERYLVSADLPEAEADAFLLRSADCHDLPLRENYLAFARAGAGFNNIPVEECTRRGIAVFNTPGANANAVKELVLCALFLGSRDIVGGISWAKGLAGQGSAIAKAVEKGKKQFVGPEIAGKTLGVIGLGAIGVLVANTAAKLGMKVIGYDPFISIDNAWHLSVDVQHALHMEDLLGAADYITIHVPLMDSTRNYLDAAQIAQMKDGVVLLNFARDGLINEEALFAALDSGKVARYLTDFPDDACLSHSKVICTPHLGASTPESEENCASMAGGRAARLPGDRRDPQFRQPPGLPALAQPAFPPHGHPRQCVRPDRQDQQHPERRQHQHRGNGQQIPRGDRLFRVRPE